MAAASWHRVIDGSCLTGEHWLGAEEGNTAQSLQWASMMFAFAMTSQVSELS